jgi:hypothetical protein
MHRWLAVALMAVAVTACGTAVPSPSVASRPPVVECLGDLDQAVCHKAAPVALAAVAASGWTPAHVWINSGSLAPTVDLLFDPSANFPAPNVPGGGTRSGSVEIAFAETDQHAGMNLAVVGSDIVADVIGYRAPLSGWCSGECPSAVTTDGPFRLELVLPHLDWKTNEPISGTAILGFAGAAPTTIYGSGGSVINFAYAELGGTRKVDPVWTADCGPLALVPATPINEGLSKSGAFDQNSPEADFVRAFLSGPDVRLPAGTWDVTANAIFMEDAGCSGGGHSMNATVRITVRD